VSAHRGRLLPFNQARSVKVAITRAYAARAAPAYRECDTCFRARARVRAHTRACTISCCTGLFRRRARIRAETSYVTHNSTNSITKFQVIPVPDLSPHDPSDRETLPYSPDFYPACIALPIAHRVSFSSSGSAYTRGTRSEDGAESFLSVDIGETSRGMGVAATRELLAPEID